MFWITGDENTNIQVAMVFSSVDVLGGEYIYFQLSEDKKMIFKGVALKVQQCLLLSDW